LCRGWSGGVSVLVDEPVGIGSSSGPEGGVGPPATSPRWPVVVVAGVSGGGPAVDVADAVDNESTSIVCRIANGLLTGRAARSGKRRVTV
jgi:hypothetical protein